MVRPSLRGLFQPKLFYDPESSPLLSFFLCLLCHCTSANAAVDSVQLRLNLQNTWLMFVGLSCTPVKDGKTGRKLEADEKINDYSSQVILVQVPYIILQQGSP